MKKFAIGMVALLLVMGGLVAEEYKGKVKAVDADKSTITIEVKDGGDKEFKVDDNTKFTRKGKDGQVTDVKNGIKNSKLWDAKPNVTVVTEKKDGKELVTEVKVGGGMRKKDK